MGDSNLTTLDCETQSLVKCFNNSELSINLTSILILNDQTNEFEPWFIAKEVASILGYSNLKKAIVRNVDEVDQKLLSYDGCKQLFGQNILDSETLENTDNFGGAINGPSENSIKINNNGMKFINESGLYSLILGSKKPEAKVFKRWVTSEVLPSIRKTGSYGLPQIDKKQLLQLTIINSKPKSVEQLAAIAELEQLHADEKKALEDELNTISEQLADMGDELEIAKSEMFTNKQVFEIVRNKFTINYADSTLKAKLGKALKSISTELNERIFYNKVTVDDIVRTTPYYAKRTVNRLLSYLDKDINYLKSIK